MVHDIITSKSVLSETAFNFAGHAMNLVLEEVEHSGHLSWSAYVTDCGGVKQVVLDYDSDEESWMSDAPAGFVEHNQIMAVINTVLTRDYTNEYEYA